MTEQELWEAFRKSRNITETEYEAWAFGEAPDELLELVLVHKISYQLLMSYQLDYKLIYS